MTSSLSYRYEWAKLAIHGLCSRVACLMGNKMNYDGESLVLQNNCHINGLIL